MSKLNVDQKTIRELFSDKKSDFLIPDYQRTYAWEEPQCQTLWDDIFIFAFPDNNCDAFNEEEEYFLGSIVTFDNELRKQEIIDGQQRLTTIMLLLRAFYSKFGNMQDENSKSISEQISQCIWKTNVFGKADTNVLKIASEVATDNDKEEFLNILKTGIVSKEQKSNYAKNYRFFQEKIDTFLNEYPSYFAYLPARILNNCILLPIEAESQDTALRIFSTLNDRGLPLSDADIFKAQFYKYYTTKDEKENFIERWRKLEEVCSSIFKPTYGTPMDELFTKYMYFVRAKQGIKSSTTEALRKFYEKDKYAILKQEDTLSNLEILLDFWNSILNQDKERFSEAILKKLFVLEYAPNGMWTYFLSVYFLHNKDINGYLEESKLNVFLTKMIAFIWAYSFTNPGVNALRTPVYAEMLNVINDMPISFEDFKFEEEIIRTAITNFEFKNGRPITKSMLAWWAFTDVGQGLPSNKTAFQIEHIFAKKRQENDKKLHNPKNLESIGNKVFLEQKINIRAADYRFSDKTKFYLGYTNEKGGVKDGTVINELILLSKNVDFTEKDIEDRKEKIIDKFLLFLKENDMIN